MVGPAGVWVLLPRQQRGTITYEKGRWRQKGGNLYLKIFAQEGLGRPDLELAGEIEALRRFLKKVLPEDQIPDIQAALVFTHDKTIVDADGAPAPTLHIRNLKEFIRKTAKSKPISLDKAKEIQMAIRSD